LSCLILIRSQTFFRGTDFPIDKGRVVRSSLRRCAGSLKSIRERLRAVEDRTTTFFRHVISCGILHLNLGDPSKTQDTTTFILYRSSCPYESTRRPMSSSSKIIYNVQEHPQCVHRGNYFPLKETTYRGMPRWWS